MRVIFTPRAITQKLKANDKFFRDYSYIFGQLRDAQDTIELTTQLTYKGVHSQMFRCLERIRDLADNGKMRDIDYEWFEFLNPYIVKSFEGNVLLQRRFPFDPEKDVVHEAAIGASKGWCGRRREDHNQMARVLIERNGGLDSDIISKDVTAANIDVAKEWEEIEKAEREEQDVVVDIADELLGDLGF